MKKDLNNELMLIKMEKFADNFNKVMKKRTKKIIISGLLATLSIIFLKLASINSAMLFKYICLGIVSISSSYVIVKASKKETESEDLNLNQNDNEEYYNKDFKEKLDKIKQKEQARSHLRLITNENVENNKKSHDTFKPNLKLIENNKKSYDTPNLKLIESKTLDKEQSINQMVEEIEAYTTMYNLPNFNISNKEWDTYFDATYEIFKNKNIEQKYYDLLSSIIRATFAKILVYKNNKVNIRNFISCLEYLECKYFTKNELQTLSKNIISKLPNKKAKILEFKK